MNAKCYRTVFNAARGMLVAVEESARGTGKGRSAGSRAGRRRASALMLTAAGALASPGLHAQSLTVDRGASGPHPVVGVAANGTPVVSINAPSAAGVSSNAFTHYNVGQAGVVLNNSGQNSQTQIAGWVQGNPFLGNNSARVILNQVTSGNPSTLAGPTEIAGNRANLIIANPAGITCSGCSFIQAPRVTLTTGTPNFDALGNLSSLSVQQGQITVNGAGLDARGAQLDLLSRAMAINGAVWAERLNAVAGANRIDYGSVTPTAIAGTGPAPQVAIDVGQLGSMYGGGATRLIGTEQGLGVNIGGNLAALTGRLDLSANGDVTITPTGRVQSAANTVIAAPNVTNQGAISTPGTVSISGGTTNTGSVIAGGNVAIAGPQIVNAGTIGAGVDANGGVTQAGSVALNATGTVRNSGSLLAGQDIGINAGSIDTGNGSVTGRGAVTLTAAGDVSSRGAAVSAHSVAVQAGGTLDNAAGSLWSATGMQVGAQRVANQGGLLGAAGDVTVAAGSVDNSAGTIGSQTGSLNVTSTGAIANAGGKLIAAQDVSLTGTGLGNQGGTVSARNLSINTGTGAIDNTGGTVSAAGTAAIGAGALVNRGGTLAAVGDVTLKVSSLDNSSGVLGSQTAGLHLDSTGDVVNAGGKLVAAQDATIRAASLGNQAGTLSARNLQMNTGAGTLDNSNGLVSASGKADLTTGSLVNHGGTLAAAGDVTADVTGLDNTSGTLGSSAGKLSIDSASGIANAKGKLIAAQDATLNATSLNNQGGAVSARGLSIHTDSGTLDNTNGAVSASGAATIQAGNLVNQGGTVAAAGNLNATVASLDNTVGGVLGSSGGNLTVTSAGSVANAGGKLLAAQDIALSAASLGNQSGTVAGRNVTVNTGTGALDNTGGAIAAAAALDATAGAVTNANGVLQAGTTLTARSQSLTNTNGALIGNAVSVNSGTLANRQGTISSATTLDVQGQSLNNAQGKLVSNGTLTIHDDTVTNAGGQIASNADVTVSGTTLDNSAGLMHAGGTLSVNGAAVVNKNTSTAGTGMEGANVALTATTSFDNTAGAVRSDQSTQITAPAIDNTQGAIQSAGTVGAKAAGALTNTRGNLNGTRSVAVAAGRMSGDGTVQSQGSVSLDLQSDFVNTGTVAAGQDVSVTTTGNVTNSGTLSAGRNLAVSANNIANTQSGQLIGAVSNTLTARGTLSNDGLIDGGATVVRANTVVNTGRLYGDAVAIQANTLTNTVNASGVAGVIASRSDMDLGVQALNNQEHALIYTVGNLRIGGALDAGNHATGSAQSVTNGSATINADANLTIAAAQINNRNNHFATADQTSAGSHVTFYRLDGSLQNIDPSTVWLFHQNTGEWHTGADWPWLGDDDYKVMVMPSAQYPFERYGPPFDYSKEASKVAMIGAPLSFPIGAAYSPGGVCSGDNCTVSEYPEHFVYSASDRIWDVFGIARPQEIGPQPIQENYIGRAAQYAIDYAAWEQRHDAALPQYQQLNNAIAAFNRDFSHRQVDHFTIYDGTQQVTRTVVTQSDPGTITSGGSMTLNAGVVNNVASQIVAGGDLTGNNVIGTRPNNVGIQGTQTVTTTGQAIYTHVDDRDRVNDAQPWQGQTEQTQFQLDVSATSGTGPNSQHTVKSVAVAATAGQGNGGATAVADHMTIAGGAASVAVPTGGAIHAVTSTVAAPAGSAVSAGTAAVTVPNSGAVIRTVVPSLTLPNNALYRVVRDPGSSVLVETDPRFTNFRQWTSSDAMLSQFRNDPGATLKRIGDGFYEQQLIQQQIIRATGQRFIGDYTNNEDEYKALLAAGVAAGKAFGLNVGTALTDEQMARLTTDIVWMVKQTVTLADGSQQEVLVPQVYLRAKDTDITGGGTLMAGNNVSFQAKGDVTNSGTIASRRVTVVTGDNIVNSGTLAGGTLLAQAAQDINNLGGHIQGDQVLLSAGRDVNLTSTSTSTTNATTLGTNISQVASVAAGALSIQARRDANLTAAAVNTTGDATITAKRDVNLNALRQSSEEHINWGNQNRSDRSSYADTGTQIQSGGKLAIGAGQDVNATAAYANATGSIQVAAGRDVHLSAGQSHQDVRDEHFQKETGFMSSKTTHTIDSVSRTDAAGTTLSGDTVAVQAGRNLTVAGSTVASTNGTSLAAGNDLTVTTTQTSSSESHYREEKKSGFGATGNGLSYGNKQQTDIANDNANTYAGSLIGSTNGNVTLKAGGDLHLTGSQAVAGGDLTAIGRNVTIDAAAGTTHHDETHITKSSGFTLGLSGGAAGLMQAASSQMQDAADAKDARASVLNGMAMGRSLYDAGNILGGKKPMDEVSVTLSWGTSQSKSTSTEDATRNQGSTLMAGGKATLIATGAKDANGNPVAGTGNLTIAGSGVSAKDVVLGAANSVNLVASQDTDKTRSENSSSSASVGISYGTKGFGVSASMSKAHGDSNSDAVIHNNAHVTGSDSVTIVSGGDTNLLGAQVNGGKVVANVGGNLNLASQQDTTKASSHQQSMGGGFSISQGGGSASASFTTQNGHSDYKGVQEQTGIYAGKGGFDINVKGNTDLKGAVIASAATPDKNTLTTGTLSFSDIHNHSEYSASSFGLSGGVGYQSEKKSGETSKAESEEPRKKAAPGGFSPMLPLMSSGSADSTTRSAVAEGTIRITNQAQQKQDLATLSRDTSNTNTVLDKNPDLGEILSRQAELQKAASAAGEAVTRTIGDIADSKRDDALAEAEKAHKAGNEELANKYRAEADQWKEGGEYRAGLHMAGGALVAGLGGGSAIGGAIGAGAASLAAPQLTELADKVASSVGGGVAGQMAGNVVANVAAGAVGSVGGGSGAFMGSNVDRYNRQLHEKETSVIRNKARQLAAAGSISYDDALERLSSQALRDVDAEYAAAHPGVDMQAQAWLNQLKAENPEGFNHMPLFQATRAEYNDSTLYAGTKLTNPDIYAAANRTPIPGTISPNRVNLMPLVTGNAKSLANTAIEVLNKGMAIVSGPFGPDVSMPLIPMTEEERAAAGATAVMAAPFGVRGSVAAADANTAAATGRAADAANAARAGETPTWTANGGAYSQSSAGAGTPVTTVRAGPGYSAADVVPTRTAEEAGTLKSGSGTAQEATNATKSNSDGTQGITGNAQALYDQLPKRLQTKTVATDGQVNTISGYGATLPKGYTYVDPAKVIQRAEEIGHDLRAAGAMDQGVPGQYSASHAEKQAIVNNPGATQVDVSRPMCKDCQAFYQAEAAAQNRPIVVSDPNSIRTFLPNGAVSVKPRD
ncbi:hemagglutinin repeat-containing protein [Ralstonia pseudosolanacearum]|uniref:hemagglutinin repeat-containing protein n=1 Tax=Ralstonia pseudosolanacearum TaxID=1310165 RepID=UPI0024CA75A0|nr:hemagglutinin repeat-containing protein [Ralstonia solanacearum]